MWNQSSGNAKDAKTTNLREIVVTHISQVNADSFPTPQVGSTAKGAGASIPENQHSSHWISRLAVLKPSCPMARTSEPETSERQTTSPTRPSSA